MESRIWNLAVEDAWTASNGVECMRWTYVPSYSWLSAQAVLLIQFEKLWEVADRIYRRAQLLGCSCGIIGV